MNGIETWVADHLSDVLIALAVGIFVAGGGFWWWRPLTRWWWRFTVWLLPTELRARADQYVGAASIVDPTDRIARRNRLCQQMGELAAVGRVWKRALAHSGHEGLVVALAGAIVVIPGGGQYKLILLTSNRQLSGHAQHQLLTALLALAARPGFIPMHARASVLDWIDTMPNQEEHLGTKIQELRSRLQ